MNHAIALFSTEIFAGAITSVVQHLTSLSKYFVLSLTQHGPSSQAADACKTKISLTCYDMESRAGHNDLRVQNISQI
jgi:hypothetical protein